MRRSSSIWWGPAVDPTLGDPAEVLPQSPSRWYLYGFLVPLDSAPQQKSDETGTDELDQAESGGADDDVPPERATARQRYLPSSIGVSVLVPAEAARLDVGVSWGDYHRRSESPEEWARTAKVETVPLDLKKASVKAREVEVPGSGELKVAYLARPVGKLAPDCGLPDNARTISIFLVNRREACA